jgi:hypothetical protein
MKTILPLTESKLRNLKPKTNLYKVFDSGGLYIEVSPHNTKTWCLKYALNGKDKRHTFSHSDAIRKSA